MRKLLRNSGVALLAAIAVAASTVQPASADAIMPATKCFFTSTTWTRVQVVRADSGSSHRVTQIYMGTYTFDPATGAHYGNAEGILQMQVREQDGSYVTHGVGNNYSFSSAAYGYQDLSTTTTEYPWLSGTEYAWFWLYRTDHAACTVRIRMY